MNFKRILHTDFGQKILSIVLGLGLATLFRKVCKGRNCMVFKAPPLSEIEKTTYKQNDKCYKFSYETVNCDTKKSIIEFTDTANDIPDKQPGLF